MKFPRSTHIFENLPITYIDLNNIVNAGKVRREDRFNSYLQLVYPDEIHFLFLHKGEFYLAVKFQQRFYPISLEYAIKRKKVSERGFCSFYQIDEQLTSILTTILISQPDKEYDMGQHNFIFEHNDGIIMVTYGIERGIFLIENGHPIKGYFQNIISDGEEKSKELFTSKEIDHISYYFKTPEIKKIVTPHVRKLMVNLVIKIANEYIDKAGRVKTEAYLEASRSDTEKKYSFFNGIKISGTNIEDNIVIEEPRYIKAYAYWVREFINYFYKMFSKEESNIILGKAIYSYRFVLKEIDFIKYLKENEE